MTKKITKKKYNFSNQPYHITSSHKNTNSYTFEVSISPIERFACSA